MAERKRESAIPQEVETADQKLSVRRVVNPNGDAVCGKCGVRIVNIEARVRCKFCWNCGTPVRWK